MSIVLEHERCIEWYIFKHLCVVSDVVKFSDMLQHVSKGVFSVMLTPQTPVGSFRKFLWMFLYGDNFASLPPCIFDVLCVGTCVWVYEVQAVVNRDMFVALVF